MDVYIEISDNKVCIFVFNPIIVKNYELRVYKCVTIAYNFFSYSFSSYSSQQTINLILSAMHFSIERKKNCSTVLN